VWELEIWWVIPFAANKSLMKMLSIFTSISCDNSQGSVGVVCLITPAYTSRTGWSPQQTLKAKTGQMLLSPALEAAYWYLIEWTIGKFSEVASYLNDLELNH
jgi:hypothetical protein